MLIVAAATANYHPLHLPRIHAWRLTTPRRITYSNLRRSMALLFWRRVDTGCETDSPSSFICVHVKHQGDSGRAPSPLPHTLAWWDPQRGMAHCVFRRPIHRHHESSLQRDGMRTLRAALQRTKLNAVADHMYIIGNRSNECGRVRSCVYISIERERDG